MDRPESRGFFPLNGQFEQRRGSPSPLPLLQLFAWGRGEFVAVRLAAFGGLLIFAKLDVLPDCYRKANDGTISSERCATPAVASSGQPSTGCFFIFLQHVFPF